MKEKLFGHKKFYELIEKEKELHSRKNKGYAKDSDPLSNFKVCEEFGIPAPFGCLVRLSDKWSRIKQVILKGDIEGVNETIADTMTDSSVYAKIFIILWEEFLKNENSKEIIKHFQEVKKLLE